MDIRSRFILVVASAGAAIISIMLLSLSRVFDANLTAFWKTGLSLISVMFTLVFMAWLGRRLDAAWASSKGGGAAGKLIGAITSKSTALAVLSSIFVVLITAIAILLFVDPDGVQFPLQPILTFLFAGGWFTYILIALNRILTAEEEQPAELAKFARNAVIGAIALSLYFLLPFGWLASSGYRAFEIFRGYTGPPKQFLFAPVDPIVIWLQSTAIPTIVSLGFGFLTAYVTSLEWYQYYKQVSGEGIEAVLASRQGRDVARDDLWFGGLRNARSRAIICGATLGGYFRSWEQLRAAINELISRESVRQIFIVLPEPGGGYFWERREDEVGRDKALAQDPVARLAVAIETLYFMLSDGKETASTFLTRTGLESDAEEAEKFSTWFEKEMRPRVENYEQNVHNKAFSDALEKLVSPIRDRVEAGNSGADNSHRQLGFIFFPGVMFGLNIFDNVIRMSPYLPALEDKDCPEFAIRSYSPLGTAMDQVIQGMCARGIWVFSRAHVRAIAYRFWKSCENRRSVLAGLASIPRWLVADLE